MGSKIQDLSDDGTINFFSNSINRKDFFINLKTIDDSEKGKKIHFNNNFAMSNFGSVPDFVGSSSGILKISDGTNEIQFTGLDIGAGYTPRQSTLSIEVDATKNNLNSKTFSLKDSSNNSVTFTFDNSTSSTTGNTIGLLNADDIDTITDRIVATINANSFNLGAQDVAFSAGNSDQHFIHLTNTDDTNTFSTNASSSHLNHFLSIGAGQDRPASQVIDELVAKINASSLNATASAISGNTNTSASLKIVAGTGATITVTEDPRNKNSGNFGASSSFTTLSDLEPVETETVILASPFRYSVVGTHNIRGQTIGAPYKTFIGIENS